MDVGILSLLVSRFFMLVAILVAFKNRREIALENTLSAAVRWLAMVAMLTARWWTPRRAVERLHAGQAYRSDTSDPVFTNEIGERLSPQAATDGFRKIAVRAKASSTRLEGRAGVAWMTERAVRRAEARGAPPPSRRIL